MWVDLSLNVDEMRKQVFRGEWREALHRSSLLSTHPRYALIPYQLSFREIIIAFRIDGWTNRKMVGRSDERTNRRSWMDR